MAKPRSERFSGLAGDMREGGGSVGFEDSILRNYSDLDFVTRLKARFFLALNAIVVAIFCVVIVYSAFIQLSDPGAGNRIDVAVMGVESVGLLFMAGTFYLFYKGRFRLASHLFLTASMISVWIVMFLDKSSPVTRLDSIAFIFGLLCVSPLVASRRTYPIFLYASANVIALWLFAWAESSRMDTPSSAVIDYVADNTVAIMFCGVVGYNIYAITDRALKRAAAGIAGSKSAEEALKRLNSELEDKVYERTQDLAYANTELQAANAGLARAIEELKDAHAKMLLTEKMAALGRLAAGISHELNTPLAAIAASNRVELKYLGAGLDELVVAAGRLGVDGLALVAEARLITAEAANGGLSADTKAERLARREAAALLSSAGIPSFQAVADELVELGLAAMVGRSIPVLGGPRADDFLFVLRGVVGTMQAARISEDAIEKATRAIFALRGYVRGGPGEEPEAVELGPELAGLVDLYYGRVKRGVDIDIDIDPGTVAMGRKEELGRIWFNLLDNAFHAVGDKGSISIEARRAGGDVFVSVIDSGPGISDAIRPRIFEPFFTTKVAGEGTGLGLNIARRLARDNGGDIGFESRPGRTEFTVRLPAAPLGEVAESPQP